MIYDLSRLAAHQNHRQPPFLHLPVSPVTYRPVSSLTLAGPFLSEPLAPLLIWSFRHPVIPFLVDYARLSPPPLADPTFPYSADYCM